MGSIEKLLDRLIPPKHHILAEKMREATSLESQFSIPYKVAGSKPTSVV